MGFLRDDFEYSGDEFFIRRQGDILLGTGTDRIGSDLGADLDTARHQRHGDTLVLQHAGELRDILMHLDHDDVRAMPVAEHLVRILNVGHLRHFRAAITGDLARRADLSA